MKAAVLQGVKKIEVLDWQKPFPSPREVLVKVKSCGICGTDQHIYHGHPGSAEGILRLFWDMSWLEKLWKLAQR